MSPAGRVGVLIVEDSPTAMHLLTYLINGDPRLRVIGAAENAEHGLELIARLSPDVVSLDVRLPGMDGLEATRRIMKDQPVPIVVVSENVNDQSLQISMNALRAGALAVVEKPGAPGTPGFAAKAEQLCTQLYAMSQVKVIRQRRMPVQPPPPVKAPAAVKSAGTRFEIVGIVTSTGGPPALVRLLQRLPNAFPLPILVVQHMGDEFLPGFAAWLGSVVPQPVQLARDGMLPLPGTVYVAPGGAHLGAEPGALRVSDGEPVGGHRPSGDPLFQSLARNFGPAAIGAVLTGMGEDGARGLLALRLAGGFTLAESDATAVIYGMPAAAAAMGAALEQHPIDKIAERLVELSAQAKEVER